MKLDIFTLFPEAFDWFQDAAVGGRTRLREGNELRLFDYRDTTPLRAGQVDDSPYGGGAGMVLRVDVVDAALQAAYGGGGEAADRAALADRAAARRRDRRRAVAEPHVALLCGRYEGFDDRVHQHLADDELSIGRYVLAGGELPAMVVADVLMRKLPGALGHADSRRRGVLQPGAGGDAGVPALHAAAALPRLGACRRSCSPATTRRCASGGSSRAASGPSSSIRAPSSYHSATARFPHPGPAVFSRQMSSVIDSIERAQLRKGLPSFGPGDRVRVHFQVIEGTRKRTQVFEGVVLRRQGSGARETFTVRKQSFGVGVERTFPLHSPKIEKLEVAARGDVRRAKLYYLRGRIGKAARVAERRWGIDDDIVSAPRRGGAGRDRRRGRDAGRGRADRGTRRRRAEAEADEAAEPEAEDDAAEPEAEAETDAAADTDADAPAAGETEDNSSAEGCRGRGAGRVPATPTRTAA